MDDNKIIELYFQRDENAIIQTKERYGERLKTLAFHIISNNEDAEECENDTYFKAWETIPSKKPQYFFAYLAKICRFILYDIKIRNRKYNSHLGFFYFFFFIDNIVVRNRVRCCL